MQSHSTDKYSLAFLVLAMSYLLAGILFGSIGSFQYILPDFLKENLSFQKSRPLHVYLVTSWIFTAAQGAMYYFIPRIAKRPLFWKQGVAIHFYMQLAISAGVVVAFMLGKFGGREYLEFPPLFGLFILLSWIPFAINFFKTVKPRLKNEPVYLWSWSIGIVFFFITLSESYLWMFDFFNTNIVRDVTVQWKALGSMVGSWNMLIFGGGMYLMEQVSGDKSTNKKALPFFFFFVGLTNLMFNWGHHTYIVPAAPWIKTVAYLISMTELLILGNIIWQWRSTLSKARITFHQLPVRLLTFADIWIFINLTLAIIISIPALNYYTHGTHITVAHAMGATIGINSMFLFGSIFYILQKEKPLAFAKNKKKIVAGIYITNAALLLFWISLVGSGLVKISGTLKNESFATIMKYCQPYFKLFAISGVFIGVGIVLMVVAAIRVVKSAKVAEYNNEEPSIKLNVPEQRLEKTF